MQSKATLAKSVRVLLDYYAEHPANFIFSGFLKTKDEHDRNNPLKPFPDLAYLRYTIDYWHSHKLTYTAKSRQLMISWLMSAYALWTIKFQPFALVLFQSKKEEDAAQMVYMKSVESGRLSLMEAHLPPWMQVCRNNEGAYIPTDIRAGQACSFGTVLFPNGARCDALAQGASQVESKVVTLFLNDEASLQTEWQSAQAAAQPCMDKGVTVGTMRLPSDYGDAISPCANADPDGAMRGVGHFRTDEGVLGIRIHYSADPGKDPLTPDGQAWKSEQLDSGAYKGGEKGWRWQQHMEINPLARSGTKCLPCLDSEEACAKIVVPDKTLSQMHDWAFDAGLDWGVNNEAVWMVMGMNPLGHRFIVHMIARPGDELGGIRGMCYEMRKHPLFERVNGLIYADPSLWKRDQNTTGGIVCNADIFRENGVILIPAKAKGQSADEVTLERLNHYYWPDYDTPAFEPILQVFQSAATKLIPNWRSLVYEEWSEGVAADKSPKEKMKDLRTDQFDAFKYAEVAWPDYPRYTAPPAPGTLNWWKGRAQPPKQPADVYSNSRIV